MGKLKGLIWDVDGTLVDTSEWIVQAHVHALQAIEPDHILDSLERVPDILLAN